MPYIRHTCDRSQTYKSYQLYTALPMDTFGLDINRERGYQTDPAFVTEGKVELTPAPSKKNMRK